MEVLYENKAPERKPFPFFHTRVAFKLPRDHKQRNLRILVYNPKKKLIYSTIVPKKESKNSKSLDSDGKFLKKRGSLTAVFSGFYYEITMTPT